MGLLLAVLIAVCALVGCGAAFFSAIDDGTDFLGRVASLGLSVVAFAVCGLLASCA